MTTIADAIKATLDAQWAIPTGGVEPTWYVTDDISVHPAAGIDYVLIQSYTLTTKTDPVNETYANKTHRIQMEVNTPTSDNRLKELADECERILNSVAITGVNWQKVSNRENISGKHLPFRRERMTVLLLEMLATSAGAYGSATATTFTADHLIATIDLKLVGFTADGIKDEDNMASDSATKLPTQQSVKAYVDARHTVQSAEIDSDIVTHTAVGAAHHALTLAASAPDVTATAALLNIVGAALMIGSANATYYPCMLQAESVDGAIITAGSTIKNSGASDAVLQFGLPLPTTRGGLKLYVSGLKIGLQDADAGDYITDINIWKMRYDAVDAMAGGADSTDYTAPAEIVNTFAAVDVSAYEQIAVLVSLFCTDASDIDLTHVKLRCYYDT